jgi:hypothetical protein
MGNGLKEAVFKHDNPLPQQTTKLSGWTSI